MPTRSNTCTCFPTYQAWIVDNWTAVPSGTVRGQLMTRRDAFAAYERAHATPASLDASDLMDEIGAVFPDAHRNAPAEYFRLRTAAHCAALTA